MSKIKTIGRSAVILLALSGAYYADKVRDEGFTDKPVVPVQGDRPTIGFGSTFYENGSPVKMGDPAISRARAWQIVHAHNQREQAEFAATLAGVDLFQAEYELFFGWRYQYGMARWKSAGILRELRQGNRVAACNVLLHYKFMHSATPPKHPVGWQISKRAANGQPLQWRFDCSTPGNKVCAGVHTRNVRRHTECMKYARLDTLTVAAKDSN